MVTAGLKWAPDMDLKDEINTKRIRPIEIALAINVTLSLFEKRLKNFYKKYFTFRIFEVIRNIYIIQWKNHLIYSSVWNHYILSNILGFIIFFGHKSWYILYL